MKNITFKGLFSIDASFAVVILLFMSFTVFLLIQSLNASFNSLNDRQKEMYLLLMSDEIVRKEAAVRTNTEVISNMISLDLLDSYLNYLESRNSSYGFRYIEVKLFSNNNTLVFFRNISYQNISSLYLQIYCIQRPVLYYSQINTTAIPAILKVCVK